MATFKFAVELNNLRSKIKNLLSFNIAENKNDYHSIFVSKIFIDYHSIFVYPLPPVITIVKMGF